MIIIASRFLLFVFLRACVSICANQYFLSCWLTAVSNRRTAVSDRSRVVQKPAAAPDAGGRARMVDAT